MRAIDSLDDYSTEGKFVPGSHFKYETEKPNINFLANNMY